MATHKLLAVILTAASLPAFSQEIQMLDPAFDHIVSADSKLERVANGFNKWTNAGMRKSAAGLPRGLAWRLEGLDPPNRHA